MWRTHALVWFIVSYHVPFYVFSFQPTFLNDFFHSKWKHIWTLRCIRTDKATLPYKKEKFQCFSPWNCDMWPMTCDTWYVTRDMWHVICDTWYVTRDTWNVTHETSHITCDMLWGVNILSKCQLPSSYGLWFMISWRLGGKDSRTDLIN